MVTFFKLHIRASLKSAAVVLSLSFGITHAQIPAKSVELAADGSTSVSKIRAFLETFPSRQNDIFKLEGYSQEASSAVSFLKSYYTLGSKGERDALLALYEQKMQPELSKQFSNSAALKKQFEDLGGVKVDAIFSWGFYRAILVVHQSKKNPDQIYPWVHTVACRPDCLFVQESTLTQIGSYLFYLSRTGKTTASSERSKSEGVQKLTLLPVFSEEAPKLPVFFTNPLEILLITVDPIIERQARSLMNGLVKLASEKNLNDKAGEELFDEGLPKAYPRKTANSRNASLFSWDAYLSSLQQRTWTPVLMFKVRDDSIIVIAKSSETDLLFLPMHKVGNNWRLFTIPSRSAFWPLIESQPFIEALKPRLK